MRVLVTAGGTRERIDDVRVIANLSTGRLGARIASLARAAGHEVLLLRGEHAERPEGDVDSEVFDTSADLAALLQRHVPGAGAVFHAAAVADYVPRTAEGKLSSDMDELVLRLRRAPKLIDGLRDLAPGALLVGFKLTSGLGEAGRVAVAGRLRERARLDLVVVNDSGRIDEQDHEALLVDSGGVAARCHGKTAIATELVGRLSAPAGQEARA
ncbi:MAG: phosphopantothenoylcysteine decarboxylase domain-containing protein [Planctomycetota bacterium]|jgi:phosphopantothenoylcysteine synthetase/decarboxylase